MLSRRKQYLLNLRYCEKATKFETVSHLFCRLLSNVKINGRLFQICEAFSENLNFTLYLVTIKSF